MEKEKRGSSRDVTLIQLNNICSSSTALVNRSGWLLFPSCAPVDCIRLLKVSGRFVVCLALLKGVHPDVVNHSGSAALLITGQQRHSQAHMVHTYGLCMFRAWLSLNEVGCSEEWVVASVCFKGVHPGSQNIYFEIRAILGIKLCVQHDLVYFDFCAATITTSVSHRSRPTLTCELLISAPARSYHISIRQSARECPSVFWGPNVSLFKLESVYVESSLSLFLLEQTNDNVTFLVFTLLSNI